MLLGLFALRVAAQPLALVVHAAVLPPFESWHSGALPYWLLLTSQLVILGALVWIASRLTTGTLRPRRSIGVTAVALGGIYFASMLARLVLGLTLLREVRWFASPVPTVFHLVLAAWLLVYGHFHYAHGAEPAPNR